MIYVGAVNLQTQSFIIFHVELTEKMVRKLTYIERDVTGFCSLIYVLVVILAWKMPSLRQKFKKYVRGYSKSKRYGEEKVIRG